MNNCKRCGKELIKRIQIPCPDNKPECCVCHYKYVCDCEDIPLELIIGDK